MSAENEIDPEVMAAIEVMVECERVVFEAIRDTLDAAASDPDLRRILWRSGFWAPLVRAEAALRGCPVSEVETERAEQVPQGPRLLLTYEEWTKTRAAEIEAEGVKGSHWPGKTASCRGGAWGSPGRCLTHQGSPIDPRTGACDEGHLRR